MLLKFSIQVGPIHYLIWMDQLNGIFSFISISAKVLSLNDVITTFLGYPWLTVRTPYGTSVPLQSENFFQNLDNFLHNSSGIKFRTYKHTAWLDSVREKRMVG
jgi:hypothetical protein